MTSDKGIIGFLKPFPRCTGEFSIEARLWARNLAKISFSGNTIVPHPLFRWLKERLKLKVAFARSFRVQIGLPY